MEAGEGSGSRAKQLIGCVLSHADDLLDEGQIVALNRLYWSAGGIRSDPDLVSEVGSLLSPEQFRTAVIRFADLSDATPVSSTSDEEAVKSLIADTSLFGLAKFEDVRKAADHADALLEQAQTKLSQSSSQLDSAEKKITELVDRASQRAAAVERELASLQESTAANSQQIARTQGAIQRIESQLGGLRAQTETGNRPAGSILRSPIIGKLYGPWGISERTASELVGQPDFPWREDFKGLARGSPEFDAAWSRVGSQEPERFKDAQHSYIQTQYFDPAVKSLKSECKLDVTARSRTFQELIWGLAVEMGPAVQPIVQACRALHDKGNWHLADPNFDDILIRAIYDQFPPGFSYTSLARILDELKKEQQHPKE